MTPQTVVGSQPAKRPPDFANIAAKFANFTNTITPGSDTTENHSNPSPTMNKELQLLSLTSLSKDPMISSPDIESHFPEAMEYYMMPKTQEMDALGQLFSSPNVTETSHTPDNSSSSHQLPMGGQRRAYVDGPGFEGQGSGVSSAKYGTMPSEPPGGQRSAMEDVRPQQGPGGDGPVDTQARTRKYLPSIMKAAVSSWLQDENKKQPRERTESKTPTFHVSKEEASVTDHSAGSWRKAQLTDTTQGGDDDRGYCMEWPAPGEEAEVRLSDYQPPSPPPTSARNGEQSGDVERPGRVHPDDGADSLEKPTQNARVERYAPRMVTSEESQLASDRIFGSKNRLCTVCGSNRHLIQDCPKRSSHLFLN